MTTIKTDELIISDSVIENWQRIVNVLAQTTQIQSAAVMRLVNNGNLEIFCTSENSNNPLTQGDSVSLSEDIYCETVVRNKQGLFVEDGLETERWNHSPEVKSGAVSYLGEPLCWPDGSVFGTLCLIGSKSSLYNEHFHSMLLAFRYSIEAELTIIYQQIKLLRLNEKLKQRVKKRTEDLATLSYSLSKEIDKRKAAEQEIYYQRNHDLSTGFLNQSALTSGVKVLLAEADTSENQVAIFHIVFTNGRKIQERYGDQVLSDILIAFRERVGNIDALASLTCRNSISNLVIAVKSSHLAGFIDTFRQKLIEVAHSEFSHNQEKIHLHAFVGIATSESSNNAEQMLFYANEAAFSCKETGQKFSYYSHANNEEQKQRNEIESYLLQAVRNDDLILYFQPKVNLKTGNWIGAEALIRWNHPILGNISNENLIQMAEQNGLIFEVGNFVLRSAIEHASDWKSELHDFKIAVNVSSIQLKNQAFIEHLEHLLDTYHFPAECLEIEITESCLISNEHLAKQTLMKLHELGVTLSLDDFGTGYASFSYLKSYPFNCIKIDKSFIQNINSNQDDKEIVHSIVQIAKRLELDVTIEGIENLDQERFVMNEGCDYAQGYLYGKPMTGKEFETCIRN